MLPPTLLPRESIVSVGADGCKGGRWIAFLADARGSITPGVFADLRALLAAAPRAGRVMVDVPIGLCDGVRAADLEAKRILSRWNSRVFLTPARCAVEAADWAEGNRVNRAATGKGLSKQAWAIVPRIREVDACLRADRRAAERVREVHPEICFWGLAGRVIAASKKTPRGIEARLTALRPLIPGAAAAVERALEIWPRSVIAADDVVDALAALAVAMAPGDELRTLPGGPSGTAPGSAAPRDEHGLRMEMVYRVVNGRVSSG